MKRLRSVSYSNNRGRIEIDLFAFIVLIMFRIDDIYYVAIIAELHIITINLSVKQTCTSYLTVHYLFIPNI